jgi:hypothetical protein
LKIFLPKDLARKLAFSKNTASLCKQLNLTLFMKKNANFWHKIDKSVKNRDIKLIPGLDFIYQFLMKLSDKP